MIQPPALSGLWQEELEQIRASGLWRDPPVLEKIGPAEVWINGRRYLHFGSNDYRGLSRHPKVLGAGREAMREWGLGAGSSRAVLGTTEPHRRLEQRLARFLGAEDALVFSTGYMANLGLLSAIAGPEDLILLDRHCHASLWEGARSSGATVRPYPHAEPAGLEKILRRMGVNRRRKIVATDSVFSMDGDLAPLPEILEVCRRQEALLVVDEAHALGVFGPCGRGVSWDLLKSGVPAPEGSDCVIRIGTLSKVLGGLGGFVAGSRSLRDLLVNKCRSFLFTTAPPPMLAAAGCAALDVLETAPEAGPEILRKADLLRRRLREIGLDTGPSQSQIVPVILGSAEKTMETARLLRDEGIWVPGIRPPTVPEGASRLRISLTSAHTDAHLDRLLSALRKIHRPP